MPEVSRFYGIIITIYHNDHPPAHFRIRYAGQKAKMAIESLEVLEGDVPGRVRALVLEWAAAHREELRQNWELARAQLPLRKIAPLEYCMAPDVVASRHVGGTVLELTFADGARREVDIVLLARPEGVFADVRSPEFVARARVNPDTGTIEWPSGADLSPELLYQAGRLVGRGGMAA